MFQDFSACGGGVGGATTLPHQHHLQERSASQLESNLKILAPPLNDNFTGIASELRRGLRSKTPAFLSNLNYFYLFLIMPGQVPKDNVKQLILLETLSSKFNILFNILCKPFKLSHLPPAATPETHAKAPRFRKLCQRME